MNSTQVVWKQPQPSLTGTVRTLQRLLPTEIVFDVELSREPLPVRMHSGELQQIVLNLGINARDAMPRGGILRIDLSEHTLDAREASELHVAPGRYVRLVCGDSGKGMDEATLARAFEPFFTTKGIGRGTGLGLSISFGIVQEHGGAIFVESQPGQGTTFQVALPPVAAAEAARR